MNNYLHKIKNSSLNEAGHNIEIRKAKPSEDNLLSDLAFKSKSHWGYDEAFMRLCKAELTITPEMILNDIAFVINSNEEITGFYMMKLSHDPELTYLFIHPAHIGNGYGAMLLQHAKEQAALAGINSFKVQSDPFAESFYKKYGGEVINKSESQSIKGRYLPVLRFQLKSN